MGRSKNDGRGRLGGRTKGTCNKVTHEARQYLSDVFQKYFAEGNGIGEHGHKFLDDLSGMEPVERVKVVISLLPFVLPKMASVELNESAGVKSYAEELEEMRREEGQ